MGRQSAEMCQTQLMDPLERGICMRRYSVILLVCAVAAAGITAWSFAAGGAPPAAGQAGRVKQIATQAQTKEFTEAFLGVLINGRAYDAFAMIKSTVPDLEAEIEAARQSTEQRFESIRPTFGKPIGWELVQTRSLGQSMIRYDYLLKFEKNALQFRVLYYKPKNVWIPAFLDFTDNLSVLFDEAGK